MKVAEVVVDVPVTGGQEIFDYFVPPHLEMQALIGSRVLVPFGKRRVEGYIVGLKTSSAVSGLKDLCEILDDEPPINEELLEVARFMTERYLCPLFSALQAMVPPSLRSRYVKWIEWNKERDELPLIVLPEEEELLDYVREKGAVEEKRLLRKFPLAERMVEHFVAKGFLRETTRVKDEGKGKTAEWVCLAIPPAEAEAKLRELPAHAAKQRAILSLLKERPEMPLQELLARTGAGRSSVASLVRQNLLELSERGIRRDPYAGRTIPPQEPKQLTPDQQQVYGALIRGIQEGKGSPFLLHGVTGSGKTEIYLQIIQHVLDQGKEAIALVPEISLTPLMVERFKGRFGDRVAVLHSGLSPGEKLDEWRRIKSGKAPVVIGARSAVFAPLSRIGAIIIDEEHETAYKQEENPRYHARDIAIKRAQLHGGVVILGSATPSMESYAFARAGRYKLLTLPKRVNERAMPRIHLVDMREEMKSGHRQMFSRLLLAKIGDRLEKREQIVLLLNRRGYSTFVLCRNCGYVAQCPHCDITLTFHQTNQTVRCHYCGHAEKVVSVCPKCKSLHIRYFGTGTQRVEEALIRQFSGVRVIRMDQDTTSRKGAHEQLLDAFGRREADILLGTQMIAKGLDFPAVTLVGLISADTTLNLPDFRAAERTFQLITQVSGRAGRHELEGEVVVQTYNPDHYSIQLAVKQDYAAFFNHEALIRRANKYPPFYRLCLIQFSHPQVPVMVKTVEKFARELRTLLTDEAEVLGPVPSPISRIKDRYRYHCMIKYKNEPGLNQKLRKLLGLMAEEIRKADIQVSVDFDPQALT